MRLQVVCLPDEQHRTQRNPIKRGHMSSVARHRANGARGRECPLLQIRISKYCPRYSEEETQFELLIARSPRRRVLNRTTKS